MLDLDFADLGKIATHLFKNLGRPVELQSNPLAAPFFPSDLSAALHCEGHVASLTAVREAILRAAELCRGLDIAAKLGERAARHYAIIARCDINREPHETVARDLGICIRHFYRERRRAHLQIAMVLYKQHHQQMASVTVLDRDACGISHASALIDLGCLNGAIIELAQISSGSASIARIIQSLCLEVNALCQSGQSASAELTLRRAKDIAATHKANNVSEDLQNMVRIRLCEAELQYEYGNILVADTALNEAVCASKRLAKLEIDATRETIARALLASAQRDFERGLFSHSDRHA